MILEVAVLNIRAGQREAFEQAAPIISSMAGYVSHSLQHGVENPDRYILLVNWQTLEDYTVGFRGSPQYQEWKRLAAPFL